MLDGGTEIFIDIYKNHCPRTIDAIISELPIRSRGIKRSNKFTITTSVRTRKENSHTSFDVGNVSLDPSSGNITIYLEAQNNIERKNLIGRIKNINAFMDVRLTSGIRISNT